MTNCGLLEEHEPLGRLLAEYGQRAATHPDREWHDRIMQLEGVSSKTLAELHGLLIAGGWLETRVVADAFREPMAVLAAYRPTRDGLSAITPNTTESHPHHQSADGPWL